MIRLIFTLLMVFTLSLNAQQVALWHNYQSGYRISADVSKLPVRLFTLKLQTVVGKTDTATDTRSSDAQGRLSGLPVTGIVWSKVGAERRVLLGDIILREGQAVPAYIFNDGRYYTLMEIGQNVLHFKMQEGNFSEPVPFDVPFSLTQPLKNSSKFSASASSNNAPPSSTPVQGK